MCEFVWIMQMYSWGNIKYQYNIATGRDEINLAEMFGLGQAEVKGKPLEESDSGQFPRVANYASIKACHLSKNHIRITFQADSCFKTEKNFTFERKWKGLKKCF